VKLIEIRWNVGSFGFAERIDVAAIADAAPIIADVQFHFTPWCFFSSIEFVVDGDCDGCGGYIYMVMVVSLIMRG
jgi:hypothetical protein